MFDFIINMLVIFSALWFLTPLRKWVINVLTKFLWLVRNIRLPTMKNPFNSNQFSGFEPLLTIKTAHTNVLGATGDGKSVYARAVMAFRASIDNQSQVLVIDPHFKFGSWPVELSVYGKGRNYDEIKLVLKALLIELSNRYERYATEDIEFPELTIFVDEVPAIATHCKQEWTEFVSQISAEGRKVNMRLITMSQSNLVELFGVKGRSDVLKNFTEVALGQFARVAAKKANLQLSVRYPVIVEVEGETKVFNAYGLHTIKLPELNNFVLPNISQQSQVCETTNEFDVKTVVTALYLLRKDPKLSARQLAIALRWGNGTGRNNQKAQRLIGEITRTINELKK